MEHLGCVIATRDRADSLVQVLSSLEQGTFLPRVVVIVDSSESVVRNSNEPLLEKGLPTVLLRSHRQSLTFQRMMGIEYLVSQKACDFVLFLDDDTFPSITFVEELVAQFKEDPDVVGVGGTTLPKEQLPERGLKGRVLKTAGLVGEPGSVSPSGVGIPDWTDGEPREVQWLMGCSLWRLSIFRQVQPRTEWIGSCVGEDIDFSLRASKHGKLVLVPRAHLFHHPNDGQVTTARQAAQRHEQFVKHRLEYRSLVPNFRHMSFLGSLAVSVISQPTLVTKCGAIVGLLRAWRKSFLLWR